MKTTTHEIKNEMHAWTAFASPRSRFNVQEKADEALQFTLEAAAHGFAIPTKLSGTSQFQQTLQRLSERGKRYVRLVARLRPDVRPGRQGKERIGFYWQGDLVGYLQGKHLGWFLPLFMDGMAHGLSFFVLQVTGGSEEKPTHGLNIVIGGAGTAAQRRMRFQLDVVAA